MNFKVFPATINNEQQKVPLIKGWKEAATDDPNQIKLWQELFRDRIKFFGIPTGAANGIVVLDIDVKPNKKTGAPRDGWKSLQQLGFQLPAETLRQQTMSGGTHLFFRAKPGVHYGNSVNEDLGLDVRGDGGWIAYYGFSNAAPLADAPDWLAGLAPSKKPVEVNPGSVIKVAPEIANAMILESLEAIRNAPDGASNDTLNTESFKVGQLVASGSISREFAEESLFKAAKERGKPDYEARATIKSGLDGGSLKPMLSPFVGEPVPLIDIPAPPEPENWTPNYLTMHDLLNTSKLRKPQLFKDWSTEDIHIVTADGGTGKTTLALNEAISFALGEPFLGFQPKQTGKTLFITGEDTAEKLGAMVGQICKQRGYTDGTEQNEAKLRTILQSVIIKKDADLCLITKDKQGMLYPNKDALNKVMRAVKELGVKVVVFDPIANFWGSESAVNDMARAVIKFMGTLTEIGVCTVMINHMGKVSSQSKDMSQFAGRGGTGLPSNSRVSRVLRPVFEEEYQDLTGETLAENQSAMLCVVNKFTDGSPLLNKEFLIVRNGYLFARKELTPQKAREMEKKLSDAERVFGFLKEQRTNDRYPTKSIVIAHFSMCNDKISKDRVNRALEVLQYHGQMGEKVKAIENPDPSMSDRVAFVFTDMDGKEV